MTDANKTPAVDVVAYIRGMLRHAYNRGFNNERMDFDIEAKDIAKAMQPKQVTMEEAVSLIQNVSLADGFDVNSFPTTQRLTNFGATLIVRKLHKAGVLNVREG